MVTPSTAKLSAIASSTCAIATNGNVMCWGDNTYGTLGNGDMSTMPSPSPIPVQVTGVSMAASVAGGSYVQCAVGATGQSQCWGSCIFGQIAGGGFVVASTSTPYTMSQFGYPAGVAATTGGLGYLCMLTRDGEAWCAGQNGSGQLGDGTMNPQFDPDEPQGVPHFTSLGAAFAGVTTCGTSSSGGVFCWGANDSGQLGSSSPTGSTTPIPVPMLGSGVTSVTAGDRFACALTGGGGVWCWGDDSQGQLGQATPATGPVQVFPSGIRQIAAGSTQVCALTTSAQVTCWGAGNPTPTKVTGLPADIAFVSVGTAHACALGTDNSIFCWGDNSFGQLGNGTMMSSTTPVPVMGFP
jgi:alpha-tubulin suppressor-like RCC1 family protein